VAPGAQSVAYSYIGPEVTWAIYKNGTIGLAKNDLERAARSIDSLLKLQHSGGRACIAVNKALVTQASSAIPVVPLYIAILYKIMKAKGTHEGCIEQMARLFATQLYAPTGPQFDAGGRIRVDDWEMREEVQAEKRKRISFRNLSFFELFELAITPANSRRFEPDPQRRAALQHLTAPPWPLSCRS
jgi:enoyl-[acyl-carrier protein] reductase/trans-2-enoyl-CoA reductase (NAD+)